MRATSEAPSPPSSRRGDKVTYHLEPDRNDPPAVGTSEYADAILEKLGA